MDCAFKTFFSWDDLHNIQQYSKHQNLIEKIMLNLECQQKSKRTTETRKSCISVIFSNYKHAPPGMMSTTRSKRISL